MQIKHLIKNSLPLIIFVCLLFCLGAYWLIFQKPNWFEHSSSQNSSHSLDTLKGLSLEAIDPPQPMPAFDILQDDGFTPFSNADLEGKPAIINMWASWCPPCRAELPSMNRIWQQLKGKGIMMVAVNVSESADHVARFRERQPIDFDVVLDMSGNMSQHWGMRGLPTTYIVNKKGEIIYRTVGERNWDNKQLIALMESLL